MKTEDIEYNGQIFSCRKIIDISSMIELLSLLAKRQQYLEDKLNFQEERINDKDKRISELEIMIKGVSLSKEEKYPSVKAIPIIKEETKNDLDDDLDAFLNNDKKEENKNIDLNEIKEEKKDDNNIKEEKPEEKNEVKPEEKKEEKPEEKKEEKKVEKIEKKSEVKVEEKDEEDKEFKDDDNFDKINNEEEIENQININFEQKQTPTLKKENLVETEQKQIPIQEKPEIKETNVETNTNIINNNTDTNQTRNIPQEPVPDPKTEEILRKLIQKIRLLESKIDQLQQMHSTAISQSIASEKANKNKLENRINLLNNKIEQLEDDQNKMKEEMGKIKVKAEDFNVYDLIKNNSSGDTNLDVAKGLVMNLENKIYKKLGLSDLKFKKDEEEIFHNKNEIKNINNMLNGLKETCNKNTKDINDLKNTNDEKYMEINNFISEINNKIKEIGNKMDLIKRNADNKDSKTNINETNDNKEIKVDIPNVNNSDIGPMMEKVGDLESKIEEINEAIDLLKKSHEDNKGNKSKVESAINQEQLKFMKDLASRISELEKQMKIILSQLNIKEVYERIETLEKDMNKKANNYEINEIKEKQSIIEENEKDLNFKMDQIQQFSDKLKGDMQQIIKKIEYLSGQINRLSSDTADMDKGKGPIIDITKLVDMNYFNEKQKEINKKFDKIRLSFEEVARNMDDILLKLSHVPSDKDFSQFQSIIRTMIDDLKISFNKKYAERTETSKSIKFLEAQIKSIQESFNKKIEGADNWLLAKKPLNNYVCASCESIIKGELGKKSEFVPWNKYPNREEKSYRYGHGFSRMLQLINEDKKRELKDKDTISDGGSDSEHMYKLPKLKRLHLNSGKLKKNNVMSDDENNIPFDKQGQYKNELDPIFTEDRPKIMKIIKRNKKVANSSYLSRLDKVKDKDQMIDLIAKTLPNEPKEGEQIDKNENNAVTNNV